MLLLVISTSSADNPEAIEYNDFLICWQDHLEEAVLKLEDQIIMGNEVEAYNKLKQIDSLILAAKSDIKTREPFSEENAFKQAALDWWEFYEHVFSYDYPVVLEISFKKNQSEKNLIKLKGLLKNIGVSEKMVNYEFKVAQKAFALKYKLYLE